MLPRRIQGTVDGARRGTALRILCSLLILPLIASTSHANPAELAWRFDAPFWVDVKLSTEMEMSAAGRQRKQIQRSRFVFAVERIPDAGPEVVLKHTIRHLTMSAEPPDADEDDNEVISALIGQVFTVRLDPQGGNLRVEHPERIVRKALGEEFDQSDDAERQILISMVDGLLRSHLLEAYIPVRTAEPEWKDLARFEITGIAEVNWRRLFRVVDGQVRWTSQGEMQLRDVFGRRDMPELTFDQPPTADGTADWDIALGRPSRINVAQRFMHMRIRPPGGAAPRAPAEVTGGGVSRFEITFAANESGIPNLPPATQPAR